MDETTSARTLVSDLPSTVPRPPGVVADFVAPLIRRNLDEFVEPGQVVELRALEVDHQGRRRRALSGFYEDLDALARDAASLDGNARGVYFTLNPLRPHVLARSPNRLTPGAQAAWDEDVARRRWLLVDIDPVRSAGSNATEDEVSRALSRAEDLWRETRRLGWSQPLPALSGNGLHLLYPIDLPPNDRGVVRETLRWLACRFSDELVKVDTAVGNPSRIVRLYGTLARKGPASESRPHRRSALLARGWSRGPAIPMALLREPAVSKAVRRSSPPRTARASGATSYGRAALGELVAEIRATPPGEGRHVAVYHAAARARDLILEGHLPKELAFDTVHTAGCEAMAGEGREAEVARTIRDAFRGQQQGRGAG